MELGPRDLERLRATQEDVDEAVGGMVDAVAQGAPALQRRLSLLQDLNSKFPATRDFLRARGLEHISELDAEGLEKLRRYLEQILADITSQKSDESPTS